MPPNRKQVSGVDTLATLNVSQFVETSKFQPLTAATSVSAAQVQVQQQHEGREAPIIASATAPSFQHDDPIKKAIIDRILTEEHLRQQFSADHIIQSNLPREETKTDGAVHHQANDADDYWAEEQPQVSDLDAAFTVRSKHRDAAYWEWKTLGQQEEKDALVQRILEEERVRQLFTAEHIEQTIVKEASKLQQKGVTPEELVPQNDSYWNWSTSNEDQKEDDVVLRAQDKEGMIQEILEAEKIRQQFAVDSIEAKLIQEAKNHAASASQAVAGNDDYWAGF
ncbi:expressed unknown protein [Seminavis robusta]|uniref:Uncharacterized protein n=1 Tax=Seminavis robusta TaxID=568900 RepID=A0A9N8DY36_9STRA|nr:expressed unknown protein [Seminavis robusta]|eukprot:Sro443_g144130.1 n/a (281) ;mRNA; f:45485-46327